MRLPGSGVEPVVEVVPEEPLRVKASDGMVPNATSWAEDGQPGDWQPTPEFSSQKTGPPFTVAAFVRVR
jgi:hypothetical protein